MGGEAAAEFETARCSCIGGHYCPTSSAPQQHLGVWGVRWRGRPEEIAQIIIDPTPLRADGGGEGPRIEIITRPGTGRWQRSASFDFSDEALHATRPGERTKPARQTRNVDLDVSGPVLPGRLDVDGEASTNRQQRAADSLRVVTPGGNVFDGVVVPAARARAGARCRYRGCLQSQHGGPVRLRDPPHREQRRRRVHPGRQGHERRAARLVVRGQRTKAGRSVRQRPAGPDEATRIERDPGVRRGGDRRRGRLQPSPASTAIRPGASSRRRAAAASLRSI